MSKVIALDFDGVIANSVHECFLVSYWAYKGVERIDSDMFNLDDNRTKESFMKFRYLVGPADEYYYLMETIEDGTDSNNDFLTHYEKNKQLHQAAGRRFFDRFYMIRKQMQDRFAQQWIELNRLYPGMERIIEMACSEERLYITSTKDEASIDLVLRENGLAVPFDSILGKSFSLDKKVQIQRIISKSGRQPGSICFIDDNPTHLIRVKPLGVNCLLARWGYNTPQGRQHAEEQGIKSITIQDLEAITA